MDKLDERRLVSNWTHNLNALGRLGDATPGVQLLTTFDDEEAQVLLISCNQKTNVNQSSIKSSATPIIPRTDESTQKSLC